MIKHSHSISQIEHENHKIKLTFENRENSECDYLIISDGVFSNSKNLISKNPTRPKYNNTLAIRGMIPNSPKIDYKDVRLLQKYVSERGKIVPRRISAVSAKKQRELAINFLHSAFERKALTPKIDSIFKLEDCARAQNRTLEQGREGAVLIEI